VLFGCETGVALGELAGMRRDLVARRGKRIDAARTKRGQVRTPGRNQFCLSLPDVAAGFVRFL
jgi:hypothetical protein